MIPQVIQFTSESSSCRKAQTIKHIPQSLAAPEMYASDAEEDSVFQKTGLSVCHVHQLANTNTATLRVRTLASSPQ